MESWGGIALNCLKKGFLMLEYFFQNPPKTGDYIARKSEPDSEDKRVLLCGARGLGKSQMALNWAGDSELLYIDLDDIRILSINNELDKIPEFVHQNGVKTIIIDNAKKEIISSLESVIKKIDPKIRIAVATELRDIELNGFIKTAVYGLDFEEFVAFSRKNYDEKSLFSQFLASGNSVMASSGADINGVLKSLMASLGKKYMQILCLAAAQTHQPLNAFAIYKSLKAAQIAISKDAVYEAIKMLNERGIIEIVPEIATQMRGRIYLGDFGLLEPLSMQKDIKKRIINMVFCELKTLNQKIFYSDLADFIINERAILVMPFMAPELIALKTRKIAKSLQETGINKIQVISNAGELNLAQNGVKIEIMPFWRWAAAK